MTCCTPYVQLAIGGTTRADLKVYRGDSGTIQVTVNDPNGNPVDISGADFLCEVRVKADDPGAICALVPRPVDPGAPNVVVLDLTPSESAKLYGSAVWDLEMTKDGQVTTLLYGKVTTIKDVSRVAPVLLGRRVRA